MKKLSKKTLHISGIALVCLFVAGPGGCVPKGEDLTPGLKGIDSDANGIRDDIDALILQKYAETPIIKNTAENYARAVQGFMEANTKQEAYEAAQKSGHMISCINFVAFAPLSNIDNYTRSSQLIKDISAYTANTRERFEKYWSSNEMISGGSFHMETKPICD
ncbi:MAG: hypothetical protein V4688_01185 [Pseudomonadota bacterium]